MFNYIKGKLAGITENSIIVENGGIGYEIFVPVTDTGSLWQTGKEVKVYTYLHVREDLVQLFGFMDKDALDLFKMLITVSGIGPKGALGILGAMGADSLRFAVLADDAKTIAKAPGIGLKTAGKLILELKDKLKVKEVTEAALARGEERAADGSSNMQMVSDAAEALAALGYPPAEALKAARAVDTGTYTTVEELLKLSLKNL
ncbi:MAG: Holliday junction branch migration protein RuvA [Lachnospiraceae bacterium]|jgi:Holliday junction DNA helicase, RuvA subunit